MLDHLAWRPRDEVFPAAHPERLACERQIDFLGFMRVGGVFDPRTQHQEAAGDPLAGDRTAQAEQFRPAVGIEKFGTEIRRRIGLPPLQDVRRADELPHERAGRERRKRLEAIEPAANRKAPRLGRSDNGEAWPIGEKRRGSGLRRQLKLNGAGERFDPRCDYSTA
jgi:hypothetical protein